MKTFLRKCLVLIAMLAPLCGVSAQETVTLEAGTDVSSSSPLNKNNVMSLTWSGGNPGANFGGSPYKIYQNNILTFNKIGGGKITEIEFTFASTSKGNAQNLTITAGEGTFNTDHSVWTGEAESVTIKYSSGSQIHISSIKITYTTPLDPSKIETVTTFTDGEDKVYTQDDYDGEYQFDNVATVTEKESEKVIEGATITYTVTPENSNIASVDENGHVTVNTSNVGTATITATYAGDNTYNKSEASYTITVKKYIIPGTEENYIKINGDDDFKGKYVMIGSDANGTIYKLLTEIEGTNKYYTGVDVTLTDGNQLQEIPEKAEGHAVFTITNLENGTDYKYTFYNTTTGKYINIPGEKNVAEVENNNTDDTHASINYNETKGGFEITFNTSTKYKFQYNSSSPRFTSYASNQQPIKLFRHGYSRDVTNGNFGTLCLPYGGTISGATLYAIEGKQMENGEVKSISLVEVDKVEAGKPYIFQATAEKLVVYYEGDIQPTAGNDNGLLGSYNGTAVEAGKYVISNNTVKKCGANSKIGKNRCYIDMDNVPEKTASAAALIISFNDSTDAIESIKANADSRNAIYDLSGRRVKAVQKGLYIVNGKKIIK